MLGFKAKSHGKSNFLTLEQSVSVQFKMHHRRNTQFGIQYYLFILFCSALRYVLLYSGAFVFWSCFPKKFTKKKKNIFCLFLRIYQLVWFARLGSTNLLFFWFVVQKFKKKFIYHLLNMNIVQHFHCRCETHFYKFFILSRIITPISLYSGYP